MTEKPAPRISNISPLAFCLTLLLTVYLGSFFYLSRAGIQRYEKFGGHSDYYDFLDDDQPFNSTTRENVLFYFYYPLIQLDARWISGRRHADFSMFILKDVSSLR